MKSRVAYTKCSILGVIALALSIGPCDGVRSKRQTLCPPNTECQPLSTCPMLSNILNNECVLRNRIDNLSCGYQGSGLVCCPNIPYDLNRINNDRSYARGNTVDGVRCGLSQVLGESYNGIGAYPWVARIGFKSTLTGEIKYPCSGSIINNRIILTAAHCALAKAENYKLFNVRVGEYSTKTEIDCGSEFCGLPVQDMSISHVVVHPGYDKRTFKDNVALIVLRNKINYTVTAQPICLPDSWSSTNNNGILVGWGKTAIQTETPDYQQVLRLPIISINKCYTVYGKTLPVTDDQLCAGGEYGKDACSGFGGSPLLVQQGDTYYQVGILSFGSDQCGAGGVPSVYTNVKKYVDWIKENTPVIYDN
ncbi:CLIP domain-containing serine protease 14D-like [Coccinella septempunctata]|uniref:CLIP domain-containing serine protease 14D-like n=1 Tax=Coccinella septempunctata TaxID=41139 RepID=UPI001D083503|nr:CLIP domain-containing serine protease 14D-like [Coccinella septempunctata]